MKNRVYQKYSNSLNVKDLIDGIEKCAQNGAFLLKEAKKQIKSEQYNLAYYLLSVSEEEFIKCFLLLHYFSIAKKEGVRQFWEYYRNHEPKKRLNLLQKYLLKKTSEVYLENIYFIINQKFFENIKQNSIYCDCVLPKKFVLPLENFVYKDIEDLIIAVEEVNAKWGEFISDEKQMETMLTYLEKNSDLVIPPSDTFKKIFGKRLSDK